MAKIDEEFENSKKEEEEIKAFIKPSITKLIEVEDKIKEYYNSKEYKKMFELISKDYPENYNKFIAKYKFVEKKYGDSPEYMNIVDNIKEDLIKFFDAVSKTIYENNDDNKYLILSLVKLNYDIPTLISENNLAKAKDEENKKQAQEKLKKDMQEYKYEHAKNLMTVRMPAFIITFFVTLFIFSFIFKAVPLLVFVWMIFLVDGFFFDLKYTKIIVERIRKLIKK